MDLIIELDFKDMDTDAIETMIANLQVELRERDLRESPFPGSQGDYLSYHIEFCCAEHGCLWDSDNCPVVREIELQRGPCSYCDELEGYDPADEYPHLGEGDEFILEEAIYGLDIPFDSDDLPGHRG